LSAEVGGGAQDERVGGVQGRGPGAHDRVGAAADDNPSWAQDGLRSGGNSARADNDVGHVAQGPGIGLKERALANDNT
jgi:hypothetical protein